MSLTSLLRCQEVSLTEELPELYAKNRTEEEALMVGLEDSGEATREKAGAKANRGAHPTCPSQRGIRFGGRGRGVALLCPGRRLPHKPAKRASQRGDLGGVV